MEGRSPERSSRIERRGRNARHKETPYARKQKVIACFDKVINFRKIQKVKEMSKSSKMQHKMEDCLVSLLEKL